MESNALMHYGVLGMKWGIRKTPKGPKSYQKGYKNFKKNLTDEQRRKNDADVEIWRNNAKRRKNPYSRFNWGPLGKDLVPSAGGNYQNASYKILDYYSRNGKSFLEDHQDRYLNQWTSQLAIDGVDYARLGESYIKKGR